MSSSVMVKGERDITGVVLAGGRARRMGGDDKGLIQFKGRPLISFALSALSTVTHEIVINANRNHSVYRKLGYPVIADPTDAFEGPLAGILGVMQYCQTPYLLSVPCDCPMMGGNSLQRMVGALHRQRADCFAAYDGERLHPVFLLLDCRLLESLEDYLKSGQRKIDTWLYTHHFERVDFRDQPEIFRNINTPEDLASLEMESLS